MTQAPLTRWFGTDLDRRGPEEGELDSHIDRTISSGFLESRVGCCVSPEDLIDSTMLLKT